jgi:hypothetical protein
VILLGGILQGTLTLNGLIGGITLAKKLGLFHCLHYIQIQSDTPNNCRNANGINMKHLEMNISIQMKTNKEKLIWKKTFINSIICVILSVQFIDINRNCVALKQQTNDSTNCIYTANTLWNHHYICLCFKFRCIYQITNNQLIHPIHHSHCSFERMRENERKSFRNCVFCVSW